MSLLFYPIILLVAATSVLGSLDHKISSIVENKYRHKTDKQINVLIQSANDLRNCGKQIHVDNENVIEMVEKICEHQADLMKCLDQSIVSARPVLEMEEIQEVMMYANLIRHSSNYICKLSVSQQIMFFANSPCFVEQLSLSTCLTETETSNTTVFDECEMKFCVVGALDKCKPEAIVSPMNELIEIIRREITCSSGSSQITETATSNTKVYDESGSSQITETETSHTKVFDECEMKFYVVGALDKCKPEGIVLPMNELIKIIRREITCSSGSSQITQYSVVTFCLVVALTVLQSL